jgi:uncharacterized protein (TIGR02647 family)
MPFTTAQLEELKVLSQFHQPTTLNGIKVHHTAASETIAATQRLFEKGLIDQHDGGYLTDLGRETVEKIQELIGLLA